MDEQKYNLEQSIAELGKLLDLSAKETDKTACEALAKKAKIIYEQFPESEEIALRYARILVSLSFKQDNVEELLNTANSVKQIVDRFNQSETIALQYAMALVNLSNLQNDIIKRKEIISELEALSLKFQNSENIALQYARILVNLSTKQTKLKERETTVEKLQQLYLHFQDSRDIAEALAKILFNLSTKQTELKEREATVEKLEKLQQEFQDSHDIALQYARILFNLSIKQTVLKEVETTAKKLEKLQKKFQDSHDIAEAFARILVNLSIKQTVLKEIETTAKKLEKLQKKFQDSHDIALQYAMILVNLSAEQTVLKEIETATKKLQELYEHKRFQESGEIAFIYGILLAILFNHQTKLSERKQTTKIIKEHYEKFSKFMIQKFDDLFFSNENICDSEEYMLFNFILREGLLKNTKYAILQTWEERYKEDSCELKNLLSIYQLVQKIKYQLGLKDENKNQVLKFGHYTKGSTLQIMLDQEMLDQEMLDQEMLDQEMLDQEENEKKKTTFSVSGKTRLYNANYMNDPEEGIVIEKILGLDRRDILEPSSWFLMSFTNKTDDLTMWSQYGDNAQGVCLVLKEDDFSRFTSFNDVSWRKEAIPLETMNQMDSTISYLGSDLKTSVDESKKKESTFSANVEEAQPQPEKKDKVAKGNSDYLYRIAYVKNTGKNFELEETELFDDNEITKLKESVNNLKQKLYERVNDNDDFYKEAISNCIEEIRYLFKSVDYKYENELRILRYANLDPSNDKIKIDKTSGIGKLYVEREKPIQIEKVIFGPKFPNPEYVTPLLKLLDNDIKYKKSTIKFR